MAQGGIGGDAPMALGVIWGFVVIALVFVGLRLYTRIWLLKMYGADDHLYNLSFLILIIFACLLTAASYGGFGQDVPALSDPAVRATLYVAIGTSLLAIGTVTTKLSLGVFLLRLHNSSAHRWVVITPVAVFGLATSSAVLVSWLSCDPYEYLWDQRVEGRIRFDPTAAYALAGFMSAFVDFWYAAVPWWLLRGVNIPAREKRTVSLSMSLGVIAGVCGIMRATQLYTLASPRYLKDTVALNIWHAAEMAVSMMCIAIPICRPLYTVLLRGGLYTRSRSSSLDFGRGYRRQPIDSEDDGGSIYGLRPIDSTPYNEEARGCSKGVSNSQVVIGSSSGGGINVMNRDGSTVDILFASQYHDATHEGRACAIKVQREFKVASTAGPGSCQ